MKRLELSRDSGNDASWCERVMLFVSFYMRDRDDRMPWDEELIVGSDDV